MEVREPNARYLVKPGFKQTEVGVIPEDWEVCTLEDVTDPKRPISYGIVQTGPSVQNGVPCLRVVDIDDGRIKNADLITTSQTISNAYRRTILQSGDLVMPLRGKVGDVALIGDELAGCNLTRGVAVIAVLRDRNALYCKHFIASPATRIRLAQSMNGSALQEIPIAPLRAFEIALPSTFAEQQAIAEALSDADALIESLEQLLTKKRQIKQGAMQELLTGQKRLPGFAGEWIEKRLGDCAVLKARIGWQGLTTAEYKVSGDYYLVTGTEFSNGYIDWGNCFFIDEARYKQDRNIQIRLHDVLVTKDGTIGKVALVDQLPLPATLNSGVFVIRPEEPAFHPDFFYYLLCSEIFTDFLAQLSAGSTINHLYQKDFVGFVFGLPSSIEEQTAIATVLSDLDAELAALETKLAKARQLKQGMMQELLTGRIRLV